MENVGEVIPAEYFPRCHHCGGMPVEGLFITLSGPWVIFFAYCHGDIEVVEIPKDVWDSLESSTFQFGVAFADPLPDPSGSSSRRLS